MAELVRLKSFPDPMRGTLVAMEMPHQIPFAVPRVFLLSGVPENAIRGDHAHRLQHQFVVAVHGAFEAVAEDASGSRTFLLEDAAMGLHVPPMTWLTLRATKPDSTIMVLASEHFSEGDYIRERAEFDRLLVKDR